ncbi:TRAP transporter small permease subunit [Albimonas sp. CAU 1670]|uniref:TRAP transporter small permease n=1 Tax=Albimonas sp. CAU 1670 TaxID=3032599 RepID=UPI0023DB05F0|nr:TRAP transporter small permease subunit [Albimonas sp. CAU 1670]MDF2235346.1 TRAP transporter small permease subunit [Albimonas sp. CAU 1670]
MMDRLVPLGGWLHRRAENVAVAMLAVMFAAFVVQVAFRYLLNLPVGWASELTLVMWLWLVLWGAGLVLPEREEIRFDVVWSAVGARTRRWMQGIAAAALLVLYGASLPAAWDFVSFMKIQKTTYLKIRYDHLFMVFMIFAVAVLIRYAWLFVQALRSRPERGERNLEDLP